MAGAFCKYCILFYNDHVGKESYEKIVSLVFKPFIKYYGNTLLKNVHPILKRVIIRFYINATDNFSNVVNQKMNDVAIQLILQRTQQRDKNKSTLKPIIETIIVCGKQEIPLRSDNDNGRSHYKNQ